MNRQDRRNNKDLIHASQTVWNYPIPPASEFEKYPDDVRKVFLSEWEKQGEHRRKSEIAVIENKSKEIEMNSYTIRSERKYNTLALIFSFLLVGSFGFSAIYFLLIGKDIQSLATFIGTLGIFWFIKKN